MRKSLITIFTLLSLISLPTQSKMIIEKEEYSAEEMMQEFALMKLYKQFKETTKIYNEKRHDPESFATSFKNIKDQHKYFRWLKKSGIKKLPRAEVSEGVASITVGELSIKYSIATLVKKEILINGQAYKIEKLNFTETFHKLKSRIKPNNKFTLFDLFISQAHADAIKGLENAMLATLIYINSDFSEREWCAISCSSENEEATKKNFEKLLSKIDEKLGDCENESAGIDKVYSNLTYFEGKDDEGGFRMTSAAKLKNFFPLIESELKDVTCESIVLELYAKDILPEAKHVLTRYLEGETYNRGLDARGITKLKEVVKSKCQRVADLNACMLNNSYAAQDVYNNSRSDDEKEFNWRSRPPKDYKIEIRSNRQ